MLHWAFKTKPLPVHALIFTYQQNFVSSTISLNRSAEAFKLNQITADSLRQALVYTRLSFKKVEFILAYYYPDFVEHTINGAPLLQVKRHSTRPYVVPPEGLQVLDELIFSDNPAELASEIGLQTQNLQTKAGVLNSGFRQRDAIRENEIIEAWRLQLVRIFTLGLTGFDTPGSLNALPEAAVTFNALHKLLERLPQAEGGPLIAMVAKAEEHLRASTSFDNFDRLTFLTQHLNPIYQQLGKLQMQMGGAVKKPLAWQASSTNLFDPNFLNPYYFTELTQEKDSPALRALGERLFYDEGLSQNKEMSCGTCHNPQLAFTDGKVKSASANGVNSLQRNAPTLLNAVYADRYFYDLRAFSLEQQAEHVIFNHEEFNSGYTQILDYLNQNETYQNAFKSAFKTKEITRQQFSSALASYVLSLQSFNSPFDQYARGESKALSPEAKLGFNLFMGKANCGTCHFAPTFSGLVPPFYDKNESEILGILANPSPLGRKLDADLGRIENGVLSEKAWVYERSFKTTTVRNVAHTAPYFHNGAYQNLEQVVEFYNRGGGAGMGLSVTNQTLPPSPLDLSEPEKRALIAFMETLSDTVAAH